MRPIGEYTSGTLDARLMVISAIRTLDLGPIDSKINPTPMSMTHADGGHAQERFGRIKEFEPRGIEGRFPRVAVQGRIRAHAAISHRRPLRELQWTPSHGRPISYRRTCTTNHLIVRASGQRFPSLTPRRSHFQSDLLGHQKSAGATVRDQNGLAEFHFRSVSPASDSPTPSARPFPRSPRPRACPAQRSNPGTSGTWCC
jgi:hypothetical protein